MHHTGFRVTFNSLNKFACFIYNITLPVHHPFDPIQSNPWMHPIRVQLCVTCT